MGEDAKKEEQDHSAGAVSCFFLAKQEVMALVSFFLIDAFAADLALLIFFEILAAERRWKSLAGVSLPRVASRVCEPESEMRPGTGPCAFGKH